MRTVVLMLAVVLVAPSRASNAQDANTWVGKEVVLKEPMPSPSHISTRGDEEPASVRVYTVKRAHRDLVYLFSGNDRFWVPSRDVLLADEALLSFRRGLFYLGQKDADKAIAEFNEVTRLTPKDARAYTNRARAWKLKGDYARASADCDEAIQIDPKSAAAHNARAWLWATCPDARLRDGRKAVESAKQACALAGAPATAACLDTLAAAYAEAGDFENAVRTQTRANALVRGAERRKNGEGRLALYRQRRPYRESVGDNP
jgi:tetratricopeptide (TPR) repeat protein